MATATTDHAVEAHDDHEHHPTARTYWITFLLLAVLTAIEVAWSYLGLEGLSGIVNFVAAFDGETLGEPSNTREVDVTLDYRIREGMFRGLWLRLRSSIVDDAAFSRR